MTEPADIVTTSILGASIPRSGHHHLSRLLKGYFGAQLKYCSTYDIADCCRAAPCVKTEGRKFVYQKSHDFAFRLPTDVAGALYLVQHRSPVANAISGAELRRKRSGMRPARDGISARARFYDFLAHRLAYYKRFHDKWIVKPPERSVLIAHEALESDPAHELRRIVSAAGVLLDEARIEATANELKDRGSRRSTYAPRVVEDSDFFDRSALGAYEAAVIDQCPAFGYAPTLGGGYRTHPVWILARLRHGFGQPFPRGLGDEFE
ncbi:sulfotransferase [Chenggangzhangella methanolivorans]|uniref:Sulfotransferase n=1 Tax=Chenggangzhangella methanolivorans TaxID=1437009 RepID=A0A9E6R8Q2_9HYPH|nr:sulfotransferase [Chenggangzhangella methanolivorans]QZN99369.1 sulfotransferase [Chenggangzhangella methanolivorans]